ncbi:Cytochrome p450 [Fragilaria crotonensis]|nr:Cytochrome p450 [Fragilaria crotonensis]
MMIRLTLSMTLLASAAALTTPRKAFSSRLFLSVKDTVTENLPPGRPVGRFLSLLFDDTFGFLHSKRMGSYQVKMTQKNGCIFRTNLFCKPAVVVADKSAMSQVFRHEHNNTMLAVVPPHHQGITQAHAQFCCWMKPSLSASKVATHETTMELTVDNFLTDLKRTYVTKFVSAVPLVRALFLSMNLQLFMGTLPMDPELMENIRTWAQSSIAHPIAILPWRTAAKAKKARKRILYELVDIAERDRREVPVTLIGKLLYKMEKNKHILDTEEIIDRMLTTVFVGADATTSAAISMWKVLSLEPEVKADLKAYPQCIPTFVSNILQTYPPGPFGMRQVKEDMQVGDYTIPSDWFVLYGLAGALHDTEPEDWLTLERNVASWAFGGGPRRCPGRFLASQELVSFGRMLVMMDWELKKRQNLKLHYNPGLFPVSGLKVRFPAAKNRTPQRA